MDNNSANIGIIKQQTIRKKKNTKNPRGKLVKKKEKGTKVEDFLIKICLVEK
jgi:hypothetical protein